MKKFLTRILLFVPFLIIVYTIFLVFWGCFTPKDLKKNLIYGIGGYANMYTRVREAKKLNDIDILFLGASHTYRGFDTRIFKQYGYKTFNFGSPNQTPLQTQLLLERYLENLNPKLIVYEIHPGQFLHDGVESSLDLLANDKIDMKSLKMAIKLNNIKTYNTLIYSWCRQLLNLDKNFREELVKDDDTYIQGGFVEKELTFYHLSSKQGDVVPVELTRWTPLAQQLHSFERIVKLIKGKNIKLIFVQAPVTKLEFNSFRDNEQFDFYISKKPNDYYNFNRLIKLNDSLHFYDSHHLNQLGVAAFNEMLIKKIIMQPQYKLAKFNAHRF